MKALLICVGDYAALELLYCATRITFPSLLSLHSTKCRAQVQNLHCFNLHSSTDRDSERPLHTAGHIKETRMHLSTLNELRKWSSGRKFRTAGCQKQAADIPQRLHLFAIISWCSFCLYSPPAVTSPSHACQFTTRILRTPPTFFIYYTQKLLLTACLAAVVRTY